MLQSECDMLRDQLKQLRTFQSMIVHELKHPIESMSSQHATFEAKIARAKFIMDGLRSKLEDLMGEDTDEAIPTIKTRDSLINQANLAAIMARSPRA